MIKINSKVRIATYINLYTVKNPKNTHNSKKTIQSYTKCTKTYNQPLQQIINNSNKIGSTRIVSKDKIQFIKLPN